MDATETTTLQEVPDYYSNEYHYKRYPAKIDGRAGVFCVWSRDVERPNPKHVTWSPELCVILSGRYRNAAWHADRAEKDARLEVATGDVLNLGGLLVQVPRIPFNTDGVPIPVVS